MQALQTRSRTDGLNSDQVGQVFSAIRIHVTTDSTGFQEVGTNRLHLLPTPFVHSISLKDQDKGQLIGVVSGVVIGGIIGATTVAATGLSRETSFDGYALVYGIAVGSLTGGLVGSAIGSAAGHTRIFVIARDLLQVK